MQVLIIRLNNGSLRVQGSMLMRWLAWPFVRSLGTFIFLLRSTPSCLSEAGARRQRVLRATSPTDSFRCWVTWASDIFMAEPISSPRPITVSLPLWRKTASHSPSMVGATMMALPPAKTQAVAPFAHGDPGKAAVCQKFDRCFQVQQIDPPATVTQIA